MNWPALLLISALKERQVTGWNSIVVEWRAETSSQVTGWSSIFVKWRAEILLSSNDGRKLQVEWRPETSSRVTGWNSMVVEGRVEVLFSSNDGLKLQVLEIPEVLRLHTTTERIIGCRLYSRVLTDVQKAIVVIRLNSDWLRNLRQLILEYNHLGCYWIQNTQLLDFTVLRILALDISKISGRRYSNEFEYRLWLVYL